MPRPRNEQGGFFRKKNAISPGKVAGHQFGWFVRQLRRDWLGFQKSKKWKSFCLFSETNDINYALVEAIYAGGGRRAAQELSDTLHWE